MLVPICNILSLLKLMQLFDLLFIKLQVPVDCTRLWWQTECCGVHFPLRTAHSTFRLITGRRHLYWRRVLHCHPFQHNRTAAAAVVAIPISLLWPAVPRLIRASASVTATAPFSLSLFHHRKPATSHPTLTRRESTRASKMNTLDFLNVSFIKLVACNLTFAHLFLKRP